jgi:CRISPR/Cas system-associated protein endoribonuclease Cas2
MTQVWKSKMLVVTEKQYESIELLLEKLTVAEETPPTETLTLF